MHEASSGGGEFARLLAEIQRNAGLTDQAVAEAAGVNRSQVWRWAHSGSTPGYEPVRRLTAYLLRAHPALSDAAHALLPAAGYEAAPGPSGTISAPRRANDALPDPPDESAFPQFMQTRPGDDFTTAESEIWGEIVDATAEHGRDVPAELVFPHSELEQQIWADDVLPRSHKVRLIAIKRQEMGRIKRDESGYSGGRNSA